MKRPVPPHYGDAPLNNSRPDVARSTRILAALDRGRTMHGPLSPEARARIFATIERPSLTQWKQTRNIIVQWRPDTADATLWILARAAGLGDAIPSGEQIIRLLESLPDSNDDSNGTES